MTLPLRKRRPITAPSTPAAARASNGAARLAAAALLSLAGAACLDAAVASDGVVSRGSENGQANAASWSRAKPYRPVSQSAADSARLKWQPYRAGMSTESVASNPAEPVRVTEKAAPVVETVAEPAAEPEKLVAVAHTTALETAPARTGPVFIKPKHFSREKLRSQILQVSGDASDAFQDPYDDLPSISRTAQAPSRPAPDTFDPLPAPSNRDPSEPARIPSADDAFRQDNLPATPPSAYDVPPQPLQAAGCEQDKKDCVDALQNLKKNPVSKMTMDVAVQGVEGKDFPCECGLGEEKFAGRDFGCTNFTWKSSGLCHKPLYFEDVQLERYGHSWNPAIQPFMSGAHFFANVALLPYKMGMDPPNECQYTLGYYRPGSCAPYMIEAFPISLRGALVEASVIVGGILIIP